MRPLRAFLYSRGENDQWGCQVFRDFETLLEAAISANGEKRFPVGVHVGFERPETQAVAELLSNQDAYVFLSDGAMGTMPLPVKANKRTIGLAGESSFHVAIDGFGCQLQPVEEDQISELQIIEQIPIPEINEPRGWVASVSKHAPDLAETLKASGIFDEESYLISEAKLDSDNRYRTGLRRYELLEGMQPTANSLIDHLRSAPPWLLNAPVDCLNLSVRSRNVCGAYDIRTIGDFDRYGLMGLYKLSNLGNKSINEIRREIAYCFISGRPLNGLMPKNETTIADHLPAIPSELHNELEGPEQENEPQNFAERNQSSNIVDGFMKTAQMLTENEREVWFGRIGFHCEPLTLQQIADQIGLTRERVRQIEVKIYKKIQLHPFWDELSQRVDAHLKDRTSPLLLNGLSAIDAWFDGADQLGRALQEVVSHFSNLGFNIINWNESPVISRLSQAQWLEAIDDAKSLLMAIADQNLSQQDALSQVAGILNGKGDDMREALQREVHKFCIWSDLPDGSRILSGFGKSGSALVLGVLQASENPLHIEEISRRVSVNSAYESANIRNVHRIAAEVGILYARGTFGLMKHCPLNTSQMLAIRSEVDDIISGGAPSKQWHSNELYDELLNRGFSYDDKLTKYIVNLALAGSPTLVYLGRMIWGIRGQWNENTDSRLDVKQAIISLLEEEGKPMTTEKIRSRLIDGRGVNTFFQIWPSSPLVRLGPGTWGLEGRDLDMDRANTLTFRLLQELASKQEGIHVSEAISILGLYSEDEASMLTSISQKDGLRMDQGQYFYLQPWGESRRMSISAAATEALKTHPQGLLKTDLQMYVERSVKRKIDRQQLSSVLQNIDAIYDPEFGTWKFVGQIFEENESDMESATGLLVN